MIRLAYTDEHFKPMGVPTPGVPMLVDDQERFVEAPQRWLLDVAILNGRTVWIATFPVSQGGYHFVATGVGSGGAGFSPVGTVTIGP